MRAHSALGDHPLGKGPVGPHQRGERPALETRINGRVKHRIQHQRSPLTRRQIQQVRHLGSDPLDGSTPHGGWGVVDGKT